MAGLGTAAKPAWGLSPTAASGARRKLLAPGLPVASSTLLLWALAAVLAVLVVYPLLMLGVGAFVTEGPLQVNWQAPAFQLDAFRTLVSDPEIARSVVNTLIVVLTAGVLATAVGVFFAWVVARTDVPFRSGIELAGLFPLFVPPLVAGIAWSFLGSPTTGLLNVGLQSLGVAWRVNFYSLPGLVFVFGLYNAPYIYLFVRPAFAGQDASLEEAACIAGASRFTVLRTITLPLVLPSILAGGLLSVVVMLGTYGIPGALGTPARIPMLATTLYRLVSGTPAQYNVAAALAMALLLLCGALVLFKQWLLKGRSFTTIGGKARPPVRFQLGRWRWPVVTLAALYLLVVVVVPTAMLLVASLRRFMFFSDLASIFNTQLYTLDHFRKLALNPATLRSVGNALELGLITAAIGGTLAFVFGYVIYRSRLPGRRWIELVCSLPVAIPSLVVGVAYLWAWIGLPVNLYGTLTIMALALVARFLPDAMQALSTSLLQIHRDLEEAAWVSGRSMLQTLREIVLPLASPGLAAAVVLLFVLAVRELGSTLFLYTSSTIPLSVYLFNFFEAGNISATAALCVLQMALLAVVISAASGLTRWVASRSAAAGSPQRPLTGAVA
jgi:iron(III) transport system permease protein